MNNWRRQVAAVRWLLLAILGVLLSVEGFKVYYGGGELPFLALFGTTTPLYRVLTVYSVPIGVLEQLLGLLLFAVNLYQFMQWLSNRSLKEQLRQMQELLLNNYPLEKGPRVVAIGGGTGLATLLRSIKTLTHNITAVVAVTDDGGSSGVLRREMGILPPGDIRNCLIALAQEERGLAEMLDYRFTGEGFCQGHNMGNLLMAGLTQKDNGDFAKAVQELSRILAVKGQVLPVTVDDVRICGQMADGGVVQGETDMVADPRTIRRVFLQPATCQPLPAVLQAIAEAEYIILGPGSLYTSIITNLLVPGVTAAIHHSAAKVYYICNAATQRGEMELTDAADYVTAIEEHSVKGLIHHILVNTGPVSQAGLQRLAEAESQLVQCDVDALKARGLQVSQGHFVSVTDPRLHDEEALHHFFTQEFRKEQMQEMISSQ